MKFATDGGKGRRGVGVTVFYRVTAWSSPQHRDGGVVASHGFDSPAFIAPLLLGEIRAGNRRFEANFILGRFFAS